MISTLKRVNKFLMGIQEYIMIFSSVTIVGMIFTGAVMRYILKMDFYGMEELLMIFAFWLYFIGSSVASYEDSHINAELLSAFIHNKKIKGVLKIFKYFMSLLISLLTTKWCVDYIMWNLDKNPKTPVYGISLLVPQSAILISFILMTIYILGYLVNSITEFKHLLSSEK